MFTKIYEKVKSFILNNWGFLLAIVILNLLFWIELPYVIYAPGGAINLASRIDTSPNYKAEGKLQMAYVSMVRGSIPFLLASYVIPNWDIEAKDDLTLDNETMRDMIKKDKLYLQESINNATISALDLLEKDYKIEKVHNTIVYVAPEASSSLKLYDEIISVDGQEISSLDEIKKIVGSHQEGDMLDLKVRHNNKEKAIKTKIYNTEDGLKAGISIVTTYDLETANDINIASRSSESGPSGGLMMALGIYNSLTKDDLTHGKNIVGTGTIDVNGNIGEIGGVKYKLIGAVRKKADIFICPQENYQEAKKVAKKNNYDIIIITDENLKGIVKQLQEMR